MIYYERWGFIYSAGFYFYFERAILIFFRKTGYESIKRQKSSYSILGESYVFIEILSLNKK